MTAPIAIRSAATIMLVRDGDDGLEVLMLRRNLRADFVGGAFVFPGGAVDDTDRDPDLEPVSRGRTDAEASALLGIEQGGLAFWVAAIRECFEEAGVLLAYGEDGSLVGFDDPATEARFADHRRAVDRGERRLADVCAAEGLRLAVDAIHYFSHWVTPEGAPRRYDTRFFVARAPGAQVALHDDRETIADAWVRPGDALDRHRAGDFDLILPTIRSLRAIGRFRTADELLAAATTDGSTAMPRVVRDANGVRIYLPGDEEAEIVVTTTDPAVTRAP